MVGLSFNVYCQDTLNFFDYSDKEFARGQIKLLPLPYFDDNLMGEKQSMDSLRDFLIMHKELRIILESHTDSRGSAAYNLKLSAARAQLLKNYLTDQGIANDRIDAIGVGESDPLEPCERVDCTALEHQKNRRTMIVIK